MLGDQGNFFLTYKDFIDTLQDEFLGQQIKTGKIATIKGDYFYGEVRD